MKVIFLKNSPVFIAIVPMMHKSAIQPKSGYRIGGPSQLVNMLIVGATPEHIICKPGDYLHLKGEYPSSGFSNKKISMSSLDYKPSWYRRLIKKLFKKAD